MAKYHVDDQEPHTSDGGQGPSDEQYELLTGPRPVRKGSFEDVFGHLGTPDEVAEQWMIYQSKAERADKLEAENRQLRQLLNEFMQMVMTDPKFSNLMAKLDKKQPSPH
jgi:hypothetical protein